MRRALAILKWVPAVVCGLLVVAWVGSLFIYFRVSTPRHMLICDFSTLNYGTFPANGNFLDAELRPHEASDYDSYFYFAGRERRRYYLTGHMSFNVTYYNDLPARYYHCPIPFALSLLIPFAIAPFTRFRFPLWSYFAWTALIALELAYYLR
jgi:hypothetical protein